MKTVTTLQQKQSCTRCGACCKQGGPALHSRDKHLVADGTLRFEDLITVRQGELALLPLELTPKPAKEEFIKIQGQSRDWCCFFYNHDAAACSIYEHRPLACGLLDCTNPDRIMNIAGKDLLNRFDLLSAETPLLAKVSEHEQQCPCPDFAVLPEQLAENSRAVLDHLENLIQLDVDFRAKVAREYNLSVRLEMFYFGRPLFHLLGPMGITINEIAGGIHLTYTG